MTNTADNNVDWTKPCDSCGRDITRYRGTTPVTCAACGTDYNVCGQRLNSNWRRNMSNWDEDVSDLDGYEDACVRIDNAIDNFIDQGSMYRD